MTGLPPRHALFDELDAFDPHWRKNYATTRQAAIAAGAYTMQLFTDYYQNEGKHSLAATSHTVPDVLGATRRLQQLAAPRSLPYSLKTIGEIQPAEDDDSVD